MKLGERLRSARLQAQLSLRELAQQVGVSAQAISKYERGQDMPGSAVLIRLSEALGVSTEWLLRPPMVSFSRPSYRAHSSRLSQRQIDQIEARIQDWLERYLTIEQILNEPQTIRAPQIEVAEMEHVEQAAVELRTAWNLGMDAIPNLIETLEAQGVKVGILKGAGHFDALALTANGTIPVMVVKEGVPGDRQRLSLAHELAHLTLKMPECWSQKEVEKAAYRFAGAFLVPRATALHELGGRRQRLDWNELHWLKHRYGMSMQAWVHRAQDLGIISAHTAQQLYHHFRSSGWHEQEPGIPYPPETTTRLERLVLRALADNLIGTARAAELLGKPPSEFTAEVQDWHEPFSLPLALRG